MELGAVGGGDEGRALEDLEAAVILGGLGCGQAGDVEVTGDVGDDLGGRASAVLTLALDRGGKVGVVDVLDGELW